MNRRIFFALFIAVLSLPLLASASEAIKLPYEAGQRFVVVQGYDTPPTHINKDLYAIDFSQDGCDAYGKIAVAVGDGKVMLAQEAGYNGGYGTQVLVVNANRIVARYAHMIPGTIPPLAIGDAVVQGEPLGEIGNTGLVEGAACPVHPGTHIHFAMYGENADGSFSPFLPEPISNYVGITAGRWYLSDNTIAIASVSGATAIIDRAMQTVFGTGETGGAGGGVTNDAVTSPTQTVAAKVTPATTTMALAPSGGVSASLPVVSLPEPSSEPSSELSSSTAPVDIDENVSSTPPAAPTSPAPSATATFDSSTLAIDLSWPAASGTVYQIFSLGVGGVDASSSATSTLIGTTTATSFSYPLSGSDFGSSPQFAIVAGDGSATGSTIETAAIALPSWWNVIQPIEDTNSNGSWYDDNWYDLGTGFYGDVRALTFKGFVDTSDYFTSYLYLDEYLDANYSQLNQSYTISNNAPFTDGLRTVTIGGLNIPLQPNKYYRLRTYQDHQNHSVILLGTSATGTAMYDQYVYGVGKVETYYPFYPYLAAIMIPNYPPLQPPNAPPNMTTSFDPLNSVLSFSWAPTTDPDTNSNLLTYQVNISTSTSLDPAQWRSVGKNFSTSTPVVLGNSYTIGVRAVDDLGNIGAPLVEPWNFPAGYVAVPSQLDHSVPVGGGQKFTLSATTTLAGIALWTAGDSGDFSCCSQSFISLSADAGGAPGVEIASSTLSIGRSAPPQEVLYQFSTPVVLSAGAYWFLAQKGPSVFTNNTFVYGSNAGAGAYFRIEQANGIMGS